MKRLPNLDPLRFFLATLVILFHVPQLCRNQGLPYFDALPIFHRGTEAVYVFFCLSGFLIIQQIFREKSQGNFSIRNFYIRRILRIFPLYYLIVFFGLAFYNYIIPSLGYDYQPNYSLWEGVLWCVFFMPNVFSFLHEPGGILEILWSIGIEEQFYLIIAPLLFLIPTKRVLGSLALIAVVYFALFQSQTFSFLRQIQAVFFYLFAGGIIAVLEEKRYLELLKQYAWTRWLIILLGVLYFVSPVFDGMGYLEKHLLLAILFPLMIHTLAYNPGRMVIQVRWLIYCGKISYGIYMYHAIILNFVVFLFLKWNPTQNVGSWSTIVGINVLTIGLTVLVSHFSYRYYETYFLKLKDRFRK